MSHAQMDSPVGAVTLLERDGGLAALHLGDWPSDVDLGPRDDQVLPAAREQLSAYFAGELTTFDLVLTATGTPWQQRVWAALRAIPYGTTTSYGELAGRLGQPTASRAVGLANARNPIGIVVPCHRVVSSTGALHGYAGGLQRKRWLLDHEAARSTPGLFA